MKVKLLISRADVSKAYGVGEEIDVPEAEALRLIEQGKAVAVDMQPARENTRKKRIVEKRG